MNLKAPIKFDNNYISLTQAIFYNFFINVKEYFHYESKKR